MEVRIESESVTECTPDARRDGGRTEREPGDAARRTPTAADADDRLGQRRSTRFAPGRKRVVTGLTCGRGAEPAPSRERGPACYGITFGRTLPIRGVARTRAERGTRTPRAARATSCGGGRDPPRTQDVMPVRCSSRASPDARWSNPFSRNARARTRFGPARRRRWGASSVVLGDGDQHGREVVGERRWSGSDLTRSSPREPRSERRASRWPPTGSDEHKNLDCSDL